MRCRLGLAGWRTIAGAVVAVLGTVCLNARPAMAQQEDPVKWDGVPSAKLVAAGGTVNVTLTASIDGGWHIYALTQNGGPNKTRITLPADRPFALADSIKADQPIAAFDTTFGVNTETYEGRATFQLPVRVDATARRGADTVLIKARYEVCNAHVCLPTKTDTVAVPIAVTGRTKHPTNR